MVIKQLPLPLTGFEVYETVNNSSSTKTIDSSSSEADFRLFNGEIKEIAYYNNIISNNFEEDYEGISNGGDISFPEIDGRFYKGKKICLKKGIGKDKSVKWSELNTVLLGFISKQTFSQDNVELELVGMSKLLDQEKGFNFKKTKRSIILKRIIESSGLKADVDSTVLKDDLIDYTNISSSGSSSTATGGQGEDIDAKVKEIIGNETDDYKKMVLIHEWLRENNQYAGYECSHKSSASAALKSLKNNCADTSLLSCAMYRSAGLESQVVHGSNHFWTIVIINGKEYASDATSHQRKINQVWKGLKYSKKCGEKPSC